MTIPLAICFSILVTVPSFENDLPYGPIISDASKLALKAFGQADEWVDVVGGSRHAKMEPKSIWVLPFR